MKVLHAYNEQRSGGGATRATRLTIELSRSHGIEVAVMQRRSNDLPPGPAGHLRAGWNAFSGSESREPFARLLDELRPDLVHVHELFPLVSPWILLECRKRGVPVVATIYDYHITCPARNHFREGEICSRCTGGREYWAVLKNCRANFFESVAMAAYCARVRSSGVYESVDHFLAPSEFTRQWMIEKAGIEQSRITTIEPVVPLPESPADPAEGSYVAFAGRFVPEKGISTLLEAAAIANVPVKLSRSTEHFVTVDLPPSAEVVVTSSRDELEAFYRGARLLVMPSLWFETFGLVAAEAMSFGIPVIASRMGAMQSLVEHGCSGLLFEAGNVKELAQRIREMWDDPERCREMGLEGRRRAARWTAERHFDRLLAVYRSIADGRSPALSRNPRIGGKLNDAAPAG